MDLLTWNLNFRSAACWSRSAGCGSGQGTLAGDREEEGRILGGISPPVIRLAPATIEGMSDRAHPNELGAFLKARRAELTPREASLPDTGSHRRVPGLRREEVAQLAAISIDYYTRLEQGRIRASASVLAALARVLQLDEDQRTYL